MIRFLIAITFAVLYCILGIPALGILHLMGKKHPEKRDTKSLHMVQWAFRVINRISGVKLTVIGRENIPDDAPVLYVGNHNSYFDIIITYTLCKGLTGYIAKDDIEKVPLLRNWMRLLYCLFLKRGDPKQNLKVILQAIDHIKNGISIFVFPEGTRGKSEEMLPFKEGSMKIAEKTGCPVIPVAISNTRGIIPRVPIVKPAHVIVEFGQPIYPKELPKEARRSMGHLAQEEIQKMLDKNKALI